jgi:hypothetical protein
MNGEVQLFRSYFLAGFDGASQLRADGRRIDLLAATGHDLHAAADYARLAAAGLLAARDSLRWHRIERAPGRYDFGEALPRLRAARRAGIEVVWDLCHYGLPDGLDIWSPELVRRFAAFARAAAEVVGAETPGRRWYVPVNEISFWAWAGGEVGYFHPCAVGRGAALKAQLVRAALAARRAVLEVDPGARFVASEPLVHVTAPASSPAAHREAEAYHGAQFEALEMIAGRLRPELGGEEAALDVVGLNYYPGNQWLRPGGSKLRPGHPLHRPLSSLLAEAAERYRRPLVLTETGAEGPRRRRWLASVAREVRAARRAGVAVGGICLHPILDYPGWDDDRHCATGLWGFAGERGERALYRPLARELAWQQRAFAPQRPPREEPAAAAHAVPFSHSSQGA